MIEVTLKLKGMSNSPLSFGRFHNEPKKERESHEDYEQRTWREKMHFDSKGNVYLPPMMLKNCLSESAKFMGMQIKGKGKSTYTKHFEAGIQVTEPIMINVKKDSVKPEVLHVPADGQRGGTKRVLKTFPKIESWEGVAKVYILDEIITQPIFEEHLDNAGKFIGVGRFRPRQNGYYGRFTAEVTKWKKV